MTLGILGGTFDPIHHGHLAAAHAAQTALDLDRILLVPSRLPPHRREPTSAGPVDRLAMAELAAEPHAGWSASDLELIRDGPSYTFDTLVELGRRGHRAAQIFFIIGADAFAEITTWHRYPAVLDLAQFAVVARPGMTLDSLQSRLPDLAARMTTPASFTRHAASLEHGGNTRVILIHTTTPEISSTELRQRVRAGASLSGLVPDAVASHISTHQLYVGTNV